MKNKSRGILKTKGLGHIKGDRDLYIDSVFMNIL